MQARTFDTKGLALSSPALFERLCFVDFVVLFKTGGNSRERLLT